jgi:predicted Rossmann-fold nucleotide-binding protein
MQAANEGAISVDPGGPRQSVGVRVELPFEQETNAFVEEMYEHKTFFSRLHQFMIASDAFVIVPGGVGTLLEMTMVWQLLQVRHLRRTPLILVGGMWAELVEWARTYMLRPDMMLASSGDMEIPQCVGTVEETIAIIRRDREEWLAQQQLLSDNRRE